MCPGGKSPGGKCPRGYVLEPLGCSFCWVREGLVRVGHVDFMLFVRTWFLGEYGLKRLLLMLLSKGRRTQADKM